jgi:phosphatidylserine/phosphatidylglycerophosphate/cardiolipin synthase-like enzyme
MIDALLELPSHLRQRLAGALRAGLMAPPYTATSVRAVINAGEASAAIAAALSGLAAKGLTGGAVVELLGVADRVAARAPRLDLVWSGPTVSGLHARNTRRVYEELLGSAERSVWASTFAFFDGPRAFEVLAKRMDATPGLRVTLLLNVQRKKGDAAPADEVVRRFAERFWNHEWPGVTRPQVFYDPRSLEPDGPEGVLHAKAVVVDDEVVFITSANLTEAALDSNIELGVLVRDRALAATVSTHFQVLIDEKVLAPLPRD